MGKFNGPHVWVMDGKLGEKKENDLKIFHTKVKFCHVSEIILVEAFSHNSWINVNLPQ